MNRLMMTVCCVVFGLAAFAGETTWTGNGGGWSDPASWTAGVPDGADTAIFAKAATVTPLPTFSGIIRITAAAKVTTTVSETTRFRLLLDAEGAEFVKGGSGDLTLSAAYGVLKGKVTVAEGKVFLAGNGEEAPGAFGAIVVKSGASAEVIESPIATCHGCVYHVGKPNPEKIGWTIDYYENIYKTCTYEKYLKGWDLESGEYFSTSSNAVAVVCPGDGEYAINGNFGYPEGFDNFVCTTDGSSGNSGNLLTFVRALVLEESESERTNHIRPVSSKYSMGFMLFHNGERRTGSWLNQTGTTDYPIQTSGARGWTSLDFLIMGEFDTWGRSSYPRYSCTAVAEGGHERLTRDALWLGVCANALTVETGATFAIADGQAFSVGNAHALKTDGSFVGASADTYLYLGTAWDVGEEPPLSLKDFPGTVRVAKTSALYCNDATLPQSTVVDCAGTLSVRTPDYPVMSHLTETRPSAYVVESDEAFTYLVQTAPACETMAEFGLDQADNWVLRGNCEITADRKAVKLLPDKSSSEASRCSIVSKLGIPAYCPFEISYDLVHANYTTYGTSPGSDFGYGVFVQSEGTEFQYYWEAWASRLAYMLPYWNPAYGFAESGYWRRIDWVTKSIYSVGDSHSEESTYISPVCANNSLDYNNTATPYRRVLSYDGLGTFRLYAARKNGGALISEYTYPNLADTKTSQVTFYPSFAGRVNKNVISGMGNVMYSNVVVKVLMRPAVDQTRIRVKENATLTATGYGRTFDGAEPAVAFSNLTLAAGATLNFVSKFAGVTPGLSIDGAVVAGGKVTVAAEAGQVTEVASFTSRNGGGLAVSGSVSVADPLSVRLSRAEVRAKKSPVALLDVTGATPAVPSIDISKVVIDDLDQSGKRIDVDYVGGQLRANATFGTVLIVR